MRYILLLAIAEASSNPSRHSSSDFVGIEGHWPFLSGVTQCETMWVSHLQVPGAPWRALPTVTVGVDCHNGHSVALNFTLQRPVSWLAGLLLRSRETIDSLNVRSLQRADWTVCHCDECGEKSTQILPRCGMTLSLSVQPPYQTVLLRPRWIGCWLIWA
jgi:hypothetical protein